MNIKDFTSQRIGSLVPTLAEGGHCMAFVPRPLPHQVTWSSELVVALSDASSALGELAGLARNLSNPSLLINPFIRREAVLSSRIEGTETGVADLYAYEAGQLSIPGTQTPPEDDRKEVANYVQALKHGLRRLEDLPCSLRLLREIHERLLRGVRGAQRAPGEFRTTQNWIAGGDRRAAYAVYVPPPVPQMNEALDKFERYLHEEDPQHPSLVRLALIHYQFEAIHPFFDGNGRVGRLLMVLLLVHWGLLPAPLLYLSAFLERHREEYYDRLLAVSQKGEISEWTTFFLKGVAEQSRDATHRAKLLQDLQTTWRSALTGKRASALGLRLADSLFERPVIDIPGAASLLEVTYQSAKNTVDRLVQAGILEELRPVGRKLFWARAIIRIVEDSEDRLQ